MTDKTIMKPRPGGRGVSKPAPGNEAPQESKPEINPDKTVLSSFDNAAAIRQKSESVAIGDNVLVDEASTLFSLIAKIRNTPKHHDVNALKRQCIELIKNYEHGLRAKSVDGEVIESARYCLCSFIDEAVLNTSWGGQSEWGAESLLSTFHNETWGGEYFYTLIQSSIANPSQHLLLLELQYLCLSLGFNGKMRVEERGAEKLEEIREQAFRAIRTQRSEHERALSPQWAENVSNRSIEQKAFPLWVLLALFGAVLLSAYMLFRYQINDYSDSVYKDLSALVPWVETEQKTLTIKDRDQSIRLRQLLQTEIQRGLIEVHDLSDRIRLRINSEQLFSANNATVKEDFQPVIAKLARSLESTSGRILITAHTDDKTVFSSKYPSNWHLSLARANAVSDALASKTDLHGRLWPEGRGEAEPIAPNDTDENRRMNRRIEIDLLP
ncbi:type IVB secretion system protein IcmH/DotU [Litoribrevibacter albus]|uniref:Flagellar motor protein n=1 Tax=Litoribrevibacter albus TaxID=1473156 RepID=A0AA37SCF7_9GAMM|nr:type IVB secretion system protein IcmH/DotU [Litoribrevibacter albus]GLQ31847.1 flagellar motor protein [Litoribrevibacter albus]